MNKNVLELSILHFFNDGIRTSFVLLLPFIAGDLRIDFTQVGFLGASQPLIASLLALPTGFIASRVGGFSLLKSLLIAYSISAVGVAFAGDVLVLILTFLIASIGFGMFHTVGFSLVGKSSTASNIGRNMGNFTSVGDIGRILIPSVAIWATSLIGWRITMTVIAGIGILLYLLLQLFLPTRERYDLDENTDAKETHKEFVGHILQLFRTKRLRLVTAASMIDAVASNPIFVFLPFLLLAKGTNPTELALISGVFFAGSLAGKAILGRLVDTRGNVKVLFFSEVAMAVCLLFLTVVSHVALLTLVAFLLGIFTKGTSPVIQTLFSQVADQTHYHKIFAISELCIGAASTLAIVLMGFVANSMSIFVVFYICSFSALIAIIPVLALHKMRFTTGVKS